MTHYTRADLDMADCHIAQGERHIVQQEQLVTSLRLKQLPTAAAEAQLVTLNATLVQHRAHRAAIAEALDAALNATGCRSGPDANLPSCT